MIAYFRAFVSAAAVQAGFVDDRDGLFSAGGEDFAHPFVLFIHLGADGFLRALVPQRGGHVSARRQRPGGAATHSAKRGRVYVFSRPAGAPAAQAQR